MKYPKIYIEEIYSTGGGAQCSQCKAPALKSMCKKHLKYAALRFRAWVKRRFRIGKCYQCNRHRCRGEQRCPRHKELNRAKCFKWARKNRKAIYAEIALRKSLGKCATSWNHNPAYKNHIVCYKCHLARKESRRKNHAKSA